MTASAAAISTAEDTPRSAYRALETRATVITVGVLVALAGVAWWSTADRAQGMQGMAQGVAHAGTSMPFDMSVVVFMAMWTTMMVAMMFPTIAPIVLLHRLVTKRRGANASESIAFCAGYLLVWSAVGLVPLAALLWFRSITTESLALDRAGGAVLIVAGLYQFSRWKAACLKACRTPLSFMMTHDFGSGAAGALRTGVSHGVYCLGCCWALMAVLFVVGLMNLAWMAAIAVVFLAEKNWRHGVALTKFMGVAVTALGLAIVIHPAWLGAFTSEPSMTTMSDMKPAPMTSTAPMSPAPMTNESPMTGMTP